LILRKHQAAATKGRKPRFFAENGRFLRKAAEQRTAIEDLVNYHSFSLKLAQIRGNGNHVKRI
jgi:hypothetical protein